MTSRARNKDKRILAIAPSSRGFGFAVLEGKATLVDWGVRSVSGNKSAGTLKKAELLMDQYTPTVLVLEDASAKWSRRSRRIRGLTKNLTVMAAGYETKVALLSRDQVMGAFFDDGDGSKYTIARILAARFPDELGHRLPPKRKPWKSEDYRMGIFDAVALAFAKRLRKTMTE